MSPNFHIDIDRLSRAIEESRRLINETRRLLESSSDMLAPPSAEPDQAPGTDPNEVDFRGFDPWSFA